MADRFVLKQFAGSATNNGAFGAAQATGAGVQPVANIKDVQSLNAFEQGWDSATLTADKLPALEEMQGLEALLCKAIKELYSEGIPLWISGETYYQYSFVNYNGVIYYNTTGSYTANNPAIDTVNWSEYKPSAAGVADKLGTATVGNETIPIYLDNGTATPCKQTAITVYANVKTYSLNEVVMTLDTNNNVKLYKSLANNNTSALSDDTKWEEVSLGGGGGEIGDVGLAPFGIDETLNLRRYLNGQVISQSQFVSFTTKLKAAVVLYPSLATTEVNWQSEKALSKLGQCGKFVIDDIAGTIRLPAVVNAQGLTDLQYLGTIKNESLPKPFDIENGVWVYAPGKGLAYQNIGNDNKFIAYSSSTYQANAPVQQEAVQYPYYIQVATGVEETLPAIREYKVNNSDFFGKSMYSDVAPDNASWLASNGQYNAKTIYPDYYDWLLAHVGETITANGGKVVLSTDAITDYDWVVNTGDETFRLPLLDGSEDLPGNAPEDITYNGNGSNYTAPKNGVYTLWGYGNTNFIFLFNLTSGERITTQGSTNPSSEGGCNIRAKKGDIVQAGYYNGTITFFKFTPDVGNGSLYYYVGDTVQDASLINAGAVLGQLSTKTNFVEAAAASMPSNRYIDLTLGASGSTYTAPANGYMYLGMTATAPIQYANIIDGQGVTHVQNVREVNEYIDCFVAFKKGDVGSILYNAGTLRAFRFYYAEGDQ